MSGRRLKRQKKRILFSLPAALEIFIVFTLLLYAACLYTVRLSEQELLNHELPHMRSIMKNYAETSVEVIRQADDEIWEKTGPLVLNDLLLGIISAERNKNEIMGDQEDSELAKGYEEVSLHIRCVLIKEDGTAILIDGTNGKKESLTEESTYYTAMLQAMESGKSLSWETAETGEENVVRTVSVKNRVIFEDAVLVKDLESANIGIIVSADLSGIENDCRLRAAKGVALLFVILEIAVIILSIAIYRSFRIFRSMRKVMRAYIKGKGSVTNLRQKLFRKRRNETEELSDLSESFFMMAENLSEQQDMLDMLRVRFDPFVPKRLLQRFGKEDIMEVELGDSVDISGDILEATFEPGFDERMYKAYIGIIKEKGGMVMEFKENGMTAFFSDDRRRQCRETVKLLLELKLTDPDVRTVKAEAMPGRYHFRIIGSRDRMVVGS